MSKDPHDSWKPFRQIGVVLLFLFLIWLSYKIDLWWFSKRMDYYEQQKSNK